VISRAHITAWRAIAPWSTDAQVEQDLIVSRALVQIFSESTLSSRLAFRGGTALHKLFLNPPSRYSEDIDLVQVIVSLNQSGQP
jgi:predicted nucleotidyltransferase component of viral defense system